MHNPVVDIVMATYNGAPYLGEQLNSLLGQTYTNWRLTIHDDGSTDETVNIARTYATRDDRIVLLADDIVGLGSARNFLHLLEHVEGDYYMFCDQDDIWVPEKIAKFVDAIRGHQGPMMVYSNSYLYTNGRVLPRFSTHIHPNSLKDTVFFNSGIQGCAVMVNRDLVDMLKPFPRRVAMHDHLMTMGAVTFGAVRYLNEGLTWYRQHELNVTGSQPRSLWARLGLFLKTGKPVVSQTHYEANEAFYARYKEKMSKAKRELYVGYFRYCQSRSVLKRLFILLRHGFTLGNKRGVLLLKTIIRKPIG